MFDTVLLCWILSLIGIFSFTGFGFALCQFIVVPKYKHHALSDHGVILESQPLPEADEENNDDLTFLDLTSSIELKGQDLTQRNEKMQIQFVEFQKQIEQFKEDVLEKDSIIQKLTLDLDYYQSEFEKYKDQNHLLEEKTLVSSESVPVQQELATAYERINNLEREIESLSGEPTVANLITKPVQDELSIAQERIKNLELEIESLFASERKLVETQNELAQVKEELQKYQ